MSTGVVESNGKASTESGITPIANLMYGAPVVNPVVPTTQSTEKPASTGEPGTRSTPEASTVSTAVEQSQTSEPAKGKPEPTELEKQLKAQSDANRRLGKENKEMRELLDKALATVEEQKAKIDGTYEEPAQPTPAQLEAQRKANELASNFAGREAASKKMAIERYGEEAVKAAIYTDPGVKSTVEELRETKPWIMNRIAISELPTMEAMQILEEEKWFSKYGNDPSTWMAKIEPELKKKHLEEFKKQASETPVGGTGPTVSETRSSAEASPKVLSLAERLYGKQKKE